MSFSTDVKNEILSLEIENDCCRHAFAYGMLLFSRAFSPYDISILTEHENLALAYADSLEFVSGQKPSITRSGAGKYKVEVTSSQQREKVLESFGYDTKKGAIRLNWANISDECCKTAFLRGAFLTCGTVNNPDKGYHFEFVVPYLNLSRDLIKFLSDFEDLPLEPKSITRNSNYVVYFKDSESIEDLLTAMGAVNSSLRVMGAKMYKDVRNNVNRRLNFESANLDKTISAAARQISAIEHIIKTVGIGYLGEDLQELAALRLENPDMSLRELGEALSTPVSRSGVNHRLQKLCRISESIK